MATESLARMMAGELELVVEALVKSHPMDLRADEAEVRSLFEQEAARMWLVAQALMAGFIEKIAGREAATTALSISGFHLGWRAREALAEREALEKIVNAEL